MLVLMFAATLTPYLGDGPFYPKNGFEYNRCRDTWWTNLIFLNNIVRAEQNKTVQLSSKISKYMIFISYNSSAWVTRELGDLKKKNQYMYLNKVLRGIWPTIFNSTP